VSDISQPAHAEESVTPIRQNPGHNGQVNTVYPTKKWSDMKATKWAIVVIAVSSLFLSGCTTSQGSGQVTLRVWDQFTDKSTKAAAKQIYSAFEAAHPGTHIEVESYLYQDMGRLAKTALASGTGPDVLYYDVGQGEGGALAKAHLIQPLTKLDAQYGWSKRLNKQVLRWSTYTGDLYGLGLEAEVNGIFTNEDLIAKAGLKTPATFDQLLQFCHDATAKGFIPMGYGQGPAILAKDMYAMVMNNIAGPAQVSKNVFGGAGGFDSPESVKALDIWFSQMVHAGCFASGVNGISIETALSQFIGGKSLMLPSGTWWVNDLNAALPTNKIGFMPFPAVSGGQGRFYPAGVGSAWMISSQTAQTKLAGELLDFMFSEQSVKTWLTVGGLVAPVPVDLASLKLSDLTLATTRVIQSGADADGNKTGFYIAPAMSATLQSDFMDWAQAITAGQATAHDVGAKMQKQWNSDH
jgi:raffinose/stachyose/melibiose transport system substrate-binding protein